MYKRMVMQLMEGLRDDEKRHAGVFVAAYAGGKTLEELSESTAERIYFFLRGYANH